MNNNNIEFPAHEFAREIDLQDWKDGKRTDTNAWVGEVFQLLDAMDQEHYQQYRVLLNPVKHGPWVVERKVIEKDDVSRVFYVTDGPHPTLDRDCGYGDTTILKKQGTTWMSDTRAEILEHSPFINRLWWCESLEPSVLINGLGIGMAVKAALTHNASRIDVVEIDQDVIDIVGPNFDDPRVHIHHADALTWRPPTGMRWTLAWHDIWPTISADNLPEMDRLQKKYRRRVQWQASWQRAGCLKLRRHHEQFQEALQEQDWNRARALDPSF